MYLHHFGLHSTPFSLSPHPEFFYAGARRGATLEALCYAILQGEGIVKVTGEVGSGKTMLCRMLSERLPSTVIVIYIANPSLSPDELLYTLAADLGLDTDTMRVSAVIRAIQQVLIERHTEGKCVVVLIDEAHAMPRDSLEEIRLLSNLETTRSKLLQIVLFGQPELDTVLARNDLRQLRERVVHSFALTALKPDDIRDYLAFRLTAAGYRGDELFSPAVRAVIAEASQGLTRRINLIADKCLLAAFAEDTRHITVAHAQAALADCAFHAPRRRLLLPPRTLAWLGAGLVLTVCGVWATAWLAQRGLLSLSALGL
jgi:type II secretory pathway predicted ATPase ExeA